MAHLIIVRGPPGSGKSTFVREFLYPSDCDHYEADMYFETENGYDFQPENVQDAHAWCLNEVRYALARGENVVVSNTFTQRWEMLPYIQYCNRNAHTFSVIKCEGNYGSVHDVPESAIERMKARWEDY